MAIAAALFHRGRTGEGSTIDLSQIESGVYSLSELIVRQSALGHSVTRAGNRSESMSPHGIYPCAGRITSYNVCYTKLLRAQLGHPR